MEMEPGDLPNATHVYVVNLTFAPTLLRLCLLLLYMLLLLLLHLLLLLLHLLLLLLLREARAA